MKTIFKYQSNKYLFCVLSLQKIIGQFKNTTYMTSFNCIVPLFKAHLNFAIMYQDIFAHLVKLPSFKNCGCIFLISICRFVTIMVCTIINLL